MNSSADTVAALRTFIFNATDKIVNSIDSFSDTIGQFPELPAEDSSKYCSILRDVKCAIVWIYAFTHCPELSKTLSPVNVSSMIVELSDWLRKSCPGQLLLDLRDFINKLEAYSVGANSAFADIYTFEIGPMVVPVEQILSSPQSAITAKSTWASSTSVKNNSQASLPPTSSSIAEKRSTAPRKTRTPSYSTNSTLKRYDDPMWTLRVEAGRASYPKTKNPIDMWKSVGRLEHNPDRKPTILCVNLRFGDLSGTVDGEYGPRTFDANCIVEKIRAQENHRGNMGTCISHLIITITGVYDTKSTVLDYDTVSELALDYLEAVKYLFTFAEDLRITFKTVTTNRERKLGGGTFVVPEGMTVGDFPISSTFAKNVLDIMTNSELEDFE